MSRRDVINAIGILTAFVALGAGGMAWLWTGNWRWAATGAVLFILLGITAGIAARKK